MSAVKRSAALTALPAGILLALAACSSHPEAVQLPPKVVTSLHPVAVLKSTREWSEGVRAHPLNAGQKLVFSFGRDVSPNWTMSAVSYPLTLVALDKRGHQLGSLFMAPCPDGSVESCPRYSLPVKAATWVETRPQLVTPARPPAPVKSLPYVPPKHPVRLTDTNPDN